MKICVFAGEKSGDLYGARLIRALKKKYPLAHIQGVGGEKMRREDFTPFMDTESFQVMGFIDVFLALPRFMRQFRHILSKILQEAPEVTILIDYPGFNLRLAKALRQRGYSGKIIHYICPSVWVWGKKRIQWLAKYYDALFTIRPFEEELFQNTALPVFFVGHPLIEEIQDHSLIALSFPPSKKVVALFPGSRPKELKRHLPILISSAIELLQQEPDLHFAISCSNPSFLPFIRSSLQGSLLQKEMYASIVDAKNTYNLMEHSHIALAKSGTVTLELALFEVPTIVIYAITKIDLFIAKDLLRIRLPYYSLPNILEKQEVFTELFGPNMTQEKIVSHANTLLKNHILYENCKTLCHKIKGSLGAHHASSQAAEYIFSILNPS